MHKPAGFLIAPLFIAYSVLVPTHVANAQTILPSVSTSTTNFESMTTAPVTSVQSAPAIPLMASLVPTNLFSVTLTSYNAVPAQTSPTPWLTASGAPSNPEVVAARSRDLATKLPYGTIIAVLGPSSSDNGPYCGYSSVSKLIGYRVIADSMAPRMHDKIDIQLDQHDTVPLNGQMLNPAVVMGACTGVQIQVVGYVDPSNMPTTQKALAALVDNSQHLAYASF
jgi:3D (Asp-Asp-Asp) domain-containing protein